MKKTGKPSEVELGAALLAWHEMIVKEYPDGLVTKATVAKMLNISPVAVARLIGRGHLRAAYFPKAPDIEELPVATDDPTWMKLVAALEPVFGRRDGRHWVIPEVCYVSLADVRKMWNDADLQKKCRIDWWNVFLGKSNPRGTI
ncbi:MAG: hypothetical protein M0Z50_00755 [Planctomycetia bacterium]|nr:hypothetical protein [Planctomycetia bacterium]